MKRLFEFLLSGCWHEWEIYEQSKVYDANAPTNKILALRNEKMLPCGESFVLRCKKCGNMKKYKTY